MHILPTSMKNKYEVRGDVTVILINSPKYGQIETFISTNKLQRANEFYGTWMAYYSKNTKSFYAYGSTPMVNGSRGSVFLHRWITNASSNLVCDHVNHVTLDNTDDNIRLILRGENAQNRKGAQRNSKSGIRGVLWIEKRNKWQVRIKGKNIGRFADIEEAKLAANEAILKLMPYA